MYLIKKNITLLEATLIDTGGCGPTAAWPSIVVDAVIVVAVVVDVVDVVVVVVVVIVVERTVHFIVSAAVHRCECPYRLDPVPAF